MAKSMRSKKVKRLRALRRDIVQPLYDKKDEAKFAAQEAALAAPKLPVRLPKDTSSSASMDAATTSTLPDLNNMEMEMDDGNQSKSSLKPSGGIGKKSLKKRKVVKDKRRGKGWKKTQRSI
ncbi:hypothetical protein Q3G72_009347 [Acer saccharum]|nr:hypothetical protein Q3G72_009347 [Acer saccharum]